MKITIETIPHSEQRYETCGDWQFLHLDRLAVRVSDLGDWRMEACLGLHEVTEALLCKHLGITEQAVDDFDMAFTGDGEPGDAPDCPYLIPHRIATSQEMALAGKLGVDWAEYEERINAL